MSNELRETIIARIKAHLFVGNVSPERLADDLLAIPELRDALLIAGFNRIGHSTANVQESSYPSSISTRSGGA